MREMKGFLNVDRCSATNFPNQNTQFEMFHVNFTPSYEANLIVTFSFNVFDSDTNNLGHDNVE